LNANVGRIRDRTVRVVTIFRVDSTSPPPTDPHTADTTSVKNFLGYVEPRTFELGRDAPSPEKQIHATRIPAQQQCVAPPPPSAAAARCPGPNMTRIIDIGRSSHPSTIHPDSSCRLSFLQRVCIRIDHLIEIEMSRAAPRPAAPRPNLSFRPAPAAPARPANPPGALVPGQRPDRALNSAQFAAARSARAAGVAAGLSGQALEVSVARAVMAVPN
jgi:hypothetical protein